MSSHHALRAHPNVLTGSSSGSPTSSSSSRSITSSSRSKKWGSDGGGGGGGDGGGGGGGGDSSSSSSSSGGGAPSRKTHSQPLQAQQATAALSRSPHLLIFKADGRSAHFQHIASHLISHTTLQAKDVVHIAIQQPLLVLLSVVQVEGMVCWLKAKLGFTPAQLGLLLKRCPAVTLLQPVSLQEHMDMFSGLGLSPASIQKAWLRTPDLLSASCEDVQSNLAAVEALFGYSGAEVLERLPNALSQPQGMLTQRFGFLRHLEGSSPSLSGLLTCGGDLGFANSRVQRHLDDSGKALLQLCQELKQLPGMTSVMASLGLESNRMTKLQYYQAYVQWVSFTPK
ncbi:MAG: hypothetical protein WDW38_000168 [Sanguina aurantia]